MKVNFKSDDIHEIFNDMFFGKKTKQTNIYEKLMTIKAQEYLLQKNIFKDLDEFKVVINKIKQPYFNDCKSFVWKDSQDKIKQTTHVFGGAKGNSIYFYGYIKAEDLFDTIDFKKKNTCSVDVEQLKKINR